MTRYYDFKIVKKNIAPDGVSRPGIVVNGVFPNPTILANWGDWIQVTVHNDMDEGTSLHWHGLLQKETPWFDGVPSVHQCPIPPGSSFVYRFRADLYGTSWWHSHYSAQTAGGLFGAMIIFGPHDNAHYDRDIGPVMLNDWFHRDYFSLVEQVMLPSSAMTFPPTSQNILINGRMNYPCSSTNATCTPNAGISKFRFISGLTYRLRLINTGAEALLKFSIDNHQMTVIANDFVPVKPYNIDVVTLGVGQRTDIIVKATGKPGDSAWIRAAATSTVAGGCALVDGSRLEGMAAIFYQSADTSVTPTTNTSVDPARLNVCANDPLTSTVPYFSLTPDPKPSTNKQIDITFHSNGTHTLWYMNNSTFKAHYADPILLEASVGNLDFPSDDNILDVGSSHGSIRVVVYNHDTFAGAHPMHLHGHNMWILAEGYGTWNGTVVHPQNPQRRDNHLIAKAKDFSTPAYMVIQFDQDNPGVWPFHCHVYSHLSGGFFLNMLEDLDAIKKFHIPSTVGQVCRDWAAWSGDHLVDEIDAGI